MKKLLLLIIMILNLVLLQAQEVKFISVNEADTSLENITFKRLPKLLQKDSLTADTLTTPTKWMLKLQKKLSKEQRQDSNIYIFFCHNNQDSVTGFLPLSGKYGYVLFDSAKTGVVELERLQLRLSTWKCQWDEIADPKSRLNIFADEEDMAVIANTYYWTPAGTPIKMTKTCTTILNIAKLKSGEFINGVLYSWEDGNNKYVANIDEKTHLFFGYVNEADKMPYNDITKLNSGETIPVNSIIYLGDCTKEDVITQYRVSRKIDGNSLYRDGLPLITTFPYTTGIKANRLSFQCPDADIQPGPGYDFYTFFASKETDPVKKKQIADIARIINQQGENGNTLYKDFVAKKQAEWKDLTTFFCYTYKVKTDPNKQWEVTLSEFRKYIADFEASLKTLSNTPSIELISQALASYSNEQLKAMNLELRVKLLRHLSKTWLTGNNEWLCLRLIEHTNDTDVKGLVDSLVKVDKAGQSLLAELDNGFADYTDLIPLVDKYHRLASATANYFKKAYPFDASKVMTLFGEKKYITWSEKLGHKYDTKIVNGKIDINGVSYQPNDYVLLYSQKGYNYLSIQANIPCMVPAYIFHYLSNTRHIDKARGTVINVTMNVLSVASGVGALNAASKVVRILAVVDISVSAADIGVSIFDDALRNKVGNDVVDAWGYLTIASGLANAGYDVYTKYGDEIKGYAKTIVNKETDIVEAVDDASKSKVKEKIEGIKKELLVDDVASFGWNDAIGKNIDELVAQHKAPAGYKFYKGVDGKNWIKQENKKAGTVRLTVKEGKIARYILGENLTGVSKRVHASLSAGGVKFVDDGNTIKYYTKNGEEFAKIERGAFTVTKPRGSRQLPSEYLTDDYIKNHLKKFEDGVAFFCPQEIIDRYGTMLGRVDGVFVIPKSKMEELMIKTKGDISLIEKELSIPAGNWSKQKMCRVDIENPNELDLRIPSGNEEGANEFFTPGGFTADGQAEAVINPIPKGKYSFKQVN